MHHCRLKDGQYGRCGARKNEGGKIVCKNYGKVTALALDPIGQHDLVSRQLWVQLKVPVLPKL